MLLVKLYSKSPVPLSKIDAVLRLSCNVLGFNLAHALINPCYKLVVVELPSPVTAIDPAVDVPVSVFVLRVAIVYPMTVLLGT